MAPREPDPHVSGTVVAGHGVASGRGSDAPYPGGSLRLQLPIFLELGLDLRSFFRGTLNVSTAPDHVVFSHPAHRFERVTWTAHHPPEDFSFVRCVVVHGERRMSGWGYRPDPRTKVEHFQDEDVVEVIAGWIDGLRVGDRLGLEFDAAEVSVIRGGRSSD